MIKYPLNFHTEVKSASGINTTFEGVVENYPAVVCAIPPSFDGPGGGYSPEDLYIMAISSCFIATFKVFAEKSGLIFNEIHANASLIIDRNELGIPELQKVDLIFTLSGVEDQEKANTIFAESEKFCLVANASNIEKTFKYVFA
jgi:organic hydroperoxide reductase OsmC/OhrA